MADDLQGFLESAVSIAKEAGQIVHKSLDKRKEMSISCKDGCSADLVTEIDVAVEKFIFTKLKESYPHHMFIGEESAGEAGCDLSDKPTWIVDPIDGTANFVHCFPFSMISIGLAINKEIVVGVAYNFFQNQLFTAKKGGGAFMNGSPISVSNVKELQKAIVITDFGYSRKDFELKPKIETVRGLASEPSHVHGIRTLGSAVASLCMVAMGGADAYVEYGLHCWDIAAGSLIVQEAGGIALYPNGGPLDLMGRGVLVAASQELATSIAPLVQHVDYQRD